MPAPARLATLPRDPNANNPGAVTIGPGYIYRWDNAGQEVIAPRSHSIPSTGLGAFVSDVYHGPLDTSLGTFESVQGNMCLGDNGGLTFTQGSGVSQSQLSSTSSGGSVYAGALPDRSLGHGAIVFGAKGTKTLRVVFREFFALGSIKGWASSP